MKRNLLKALFAVSALSLPAVTFAQTKIYIDPGHGGSDSGAVNDTFGTEEADRVLFTGLALRDFLEADALDTSGGGNWEVRLSRTTDVEVDLTARSVDANNWGAARFLSIHQNAFNDSANGTETFSFSSTGTSADLSALVQSEAIEAWGRIDRGTKTAGFSVLVNTSMPAILTEMGFVDSPTDHPFCVSDVECELYAQHMMFAVQQHFGFAEFIPDTGPQVTNDAILGPDYSETGGWTESGFGTPFGANARFTSVQGSSAKATFTPDIPESGEYKVEAWWTDGANRSNNAVFVIGHIGGPTNVGVNQEINGGQWNSLGNFEFPAGSSSTIVLDAALSNDEGDAGTVIISDAIRLTKVGEISSSVDDFLTLDFD